MMAVTKPTAGVGTTAKGLTLIYAQILPVMAIVSLFPVIPQLFAQFGAHPYAGLLVPMIVTAPSLCAALFAPLAGTIADRFGRRRAMVFGMGLYVVAGTAPLYLHDLVAIVASRAILGFAEAFAITISSTLIGDYFGERRYKWVAWVGAATSIAGTVLIAAGGALADISWRGPFAIYLLALPAFILALIFIDEPLKVVREEADGPRARFPWRAALLIGSVTLITSVLYYVEPLNIATLLAQNGAGSSTQIGLIQAATSLPYIAGAFLYRWLHAWTVGRLLGLAGVLIGLGMIVMGFASSHQTVAIGGAIQQLGAGMVIPTLLAWGQAILPIEQRGRGMGIWATSFFAGTFLCPPIVGLVSGFAGGLQAALLAFGVVAILLAIAAPFIMTRSRSAPIPA